MPNQHLTRSDVSCRTVPHFQTARRVCARSTTVPRNRHSTVSCTCSLLAVSPLFIPRSQHHDFLTRSPQEVYDSGRTTLRCLRRDSNQHVFMELGCCKSQCSGGAVPDTSWQRVRAQHCWLGMHRVGILPTSNMLRFSNSYTYVSGINVITLILTAHWQM